MLILGFFQARTARALKCHYLFPVRDGTCGLRYPLQRSDINLGTDERCLEDVCVYRDHTAR